MKQPTSSLNWLMTAVLLLVVLAALAPMLIALADALLPMVVVLTIAVVAVRLVFVHTRRW